ncbi:MAG TPA: hypothetical protein VM432_07375 [Bdellovibrionales bacterium]|jgi:hypothetical protein|nr:hypothetical protein [Bdellovibrionales bacterium]
MKRILGLMMLAVLMTACQPKKDDSAAVKQSRGGNSSRSRVPEGSTTSATLAGVRINGAVVSDPYYQEDFNELVAKMMEMVIDNESVGYVSAQPDAETGLYVGAKVLLEGNAKVRNDQGNAYATNQSRLVIAVFDRFDDASLPGLPGMEFKLIYGEVRGNEAYLEYQQVGDGGMIENYIRLEGTMAAGMFKARMTFDVQSMWDGSGEGSAGYFEYLKIPTCDIFACK